MAKKRIFGSKGGDLKGGGRFSFFCGKGGENGLFISFYSNPSPWNWKEPPGEKRSLPKVYWVVACYRGGEKRFFRIFGVSFVPPLFPLVISTHAGRKWWFLTNAQCALFSLLFPGRCDTRYMAMGNPFTKSGEATSQTIFSLFPSPRTQKHHQTASIFGFRGKEEEGAQFCGLLVGGERVRETGTCLGLTRRGRVKRGEVLCCTVHTLPFIACVKFGKWWWFLFSKSHSNSNYRESLVRKNFPESACLLSVAYCPGDYCIGRSFILKIGETSFVVLPCWPCTGMRGSPGMRTGPEWWWRVFCGRRRRKREQIMPSPSLSLLLVPPKKK